MRQSVEAHISQCLICQQVKHSTKVLAGLLQPLPIMKTIWEDVIKDFVTVLPPSKSLIVIMVVVDHLSKSAHFGSLPTDFTVAKMIITQKRAFSSI